MHTTTLTTKLDARSPKSAATSTECGRRLWGEPTGLACVLTTGHRGGHVYHDPRGSDINDRHADGGHG